MDLVNEQVHVQAGERLTMSWQSWAWPRVQSSRCLHCNPVIHQIFTGAAGLKNLVVADLLMTIWVTEFVEQS